MAAASGARKHKGTVHDFGPLCDWKAALDRFNREWPHIVEGRTPPPIDNGDGCTVRDLCNSFIVHKQELMENGERSVTTYADHYRTCEMVLERFGPERIVENGNRS